MIIGGINWGLIEFFNYNLVSGIFGAQLWSFPSRHLAIVGLRHYTDYLFISGRAARRTRIKVYM